MKTEVAMERPAFTLQGSSYNGIGEVIEVSFFELRRAEVGERWEALDTHNCGRDLNEESAEVVYYDSDGNWDGRYAPHFFHRSPHLFLGYVPQAVRYRGFQRQWWMHPSCTLEEVQEAVAKLPNLRRDYAAEGNGYK